MVGTLGIWNRVVMAVVVSGLTVLAAPRPVQAADALPEVIPASPEAMATWQARRFGMFIHWGPVSLKGTEIGWSRGREIPIEEYDQLYKQFNPVEFDARAWVDVAKRAGMKYVNITSKHHDGFCIWPSEYTDYDIAGTPFGRDVLRELSDACREAGIAFGTYHSVCDWWHPDYPKGSPGGQTDKPNPNLERYIAYLRNQVTELVQNYGPLHTMWFDVPREVGPEYGIPTINMLRELQPDIVINNRAYLADVNSPRAGLQDNVGDYSTPEQRVGEFNRERPWETCMTICKQWAWKPNDTMKSLEQCLQTLLLTVGGDGNLLFNVGPMPDGRIEPRQVDRLLEMGAWLDKYGDGVYGTRGGPFMPDLKWGASTCKGDTIYLFVMQWPKTGPLSLPAIDAKVLSAEALTGGAATLSQNDTGITIDLPTADRVPIATVIKLTVSKPAFEITPGAVTVAE